MPLLLVRHGQALAAESSDEARALSLAGRAEVRALAVRMRDHGLAVGAVLSSPLVRAVQTAELLASGTGYAGVLEIEPALAPDGDPRHAENVLRARAAGGLLVVVTHEPIVRVIAARLLGRATFPSFRTAGACLIDGQELTLRLDPEG